MPSYFASADNIGFVKLLVPGTYISISGPLLQFITARPMVAIVIGHSYHCDGSWLCKNVREAQCNCES